MHFEKLYPPPGADRRWTLLVESAGQVALHAQIQAAGATLKDFYFGASLIHRLGEGEDPATVARTPGDRQAGLQSVMDTYGTERVTALLPKLMTDGAIPLPEPAKKQNTFPMNGWKLLRGLATGEKISDLRRDFGDSWTDAWSHTCAALGLEPPANEFRLVYHAYGLPAGVRNGGGLPGIDPSDDQLRLIVRAPQVITASHTIQLTRDELRALLSTSDDKHEARRDIKEQLQALSDEEMSAKAIALGLVTLEEQDPASYIPTREAMRAYAGLLLGHTRRQLENLFGTPHAHEPQQSARNLCGHVTRLLRVAGGQRSSSALLVKRAFERRLLTLGDPYSPEELKAAAVPPNKRT